MSSPTADYQLTKSLKLAALLASGEAFSLDLIAGRLGISAQEIVPYLESLKNAGFVIKNGDKNYKIEKIPVEYSPFVQLLSLADDEKQQIQKGFEQLREQNLIQEELYTKAKALFNTEHIPLPGINNLDIEHVRALKQAIRDQKQVVLNSYKSANSVRIDDRLVEPFMFNHDYVSIWCYEPISAQNKLFKISRIGSVEILDRPWEYAAEHETNLVDVFRVGGDKKKPVKMYLSLRAYNLLIEEYPAAGQFIKPFNEKMYLFDGWVCSYEGITRFVLGLVNEVIVLQPKEFKDFLYQRIRGKRF